MSSERLRIGVVGLGDIARKAYLPVLATRADLDVRLCTRNRGVLDELGEAYRLAHRYLDLSDLLADGIDAAFVHVATSAHHDVVAMLLAAGVPVYVDKPLTDSLDTAADLVDRARAAGCSLMVGFNRRYAPVYRELAQLPRSLVIMQKNRVALPDEPRRVVFDDFVHVVDTLRFLAPDASYLDVKAATRNGRVHLIVVTLSGAGVTSIGVMNREAGRSEELLEVHGPALKRTVRDLADVIDERDGRETITRRGDWTPVVEQRGFAAICGRFLDAVRSGEVLDAGDALRTHELCERIVEAIGSC